MENKIKHLVGILIAFSLLASGCSSPAPSDSASQSTSISQTQAVKGASTQNADRGLSNNNYYTNSTGNQVHSPANETKSGEVPAGATARCKDSTFSFSQHHSGTCSHHGGVAQWLQ